MSQVKTFRGPLGGFNGGVVYEVTTANKQSYNVWFTKDFRMHTIEHRGRKGALPKKGGKLWSEIERKAETVLRAVAEGKAV